MGTKITNYARAKRKRAGDDPAVEVLGGKAGRLEKAAPGEKRTSLAALESDDDGHGRSVERALRRAYAVIDRESYLHWGLTSEWDGRGGGRTRGESQRESWELPKGGDEASEGYGELTKGSVGRVVEAMEGVAALGAMESFLDAGSGYGKVVMHAALATGAGRVKGREVVRGRQRIAERAKAKIQGDDTHLTADQRGRVAKAALEGGDAAKEAGEFTHVFCYDKVFSERTLERMASSLASGRPRVLASFHGEQVWRGLGLGAKEEQRVRARTTGRESFMVHILRICDT